MLKRAAGLALKAGRGSGAAEISFVMVPDAAIRKLNKRYRGVDRVTDVISFRLSEKPLRGDIYIARGRSKKQAGENGNGWVPELCYLVLHGVLHLLNYTDYKPAERKKMFSVQDRLFKCLFKAD